MSASGLFPRFSVDLNDPMVLKIHTGYVSAFRDSENQQRLPVLTLMEMMSGMPVPGPSSSLCMVLYNPMVL